MNRKVVSAVLALAVIPALSLPHAGAEPGANAASGPAAEAGCSFGSCFSPSFVAAGARAVYRGPAAARIEFGDCCMAGDTYKVVAKNGSGHKAVTVFTSEGSLERDCTTGPYRNMHAIELSGGATVVKMIAMRLPGGTPASAYVRMSSGGWRQTAGGVGCGF